MKKICMVLTIVLVVLVCVSCGSIIGREKSNVYLPNSSSEHVVKESAKPSIPVQDEVVEEKKVEATEEPIVKSESSDEVKVEEIVSENYYQEYDVQNEEEEEYPYNYNYLEEENRANTAAEASTEVLDEEETEQAEQPEVTTEYSEKKLIATGSTTFNPNQIERSSNIRLAASHINGLILKPGEEFSFNGIVGKRTAERGFLPADIFVGQSVTKGYGGGICQTSSTICIAVKQTSMKILEQNPHSQRVTYTTIENEAMINYGTSDFRFVNTYDYPVMIEISFEESSGRETIKCDIFGLE